jgi:carboxymethylenebutenolidase
MKPVIENLYQEFKRGDIDRRTFLKRLVPLVGGTAAALTFLNTVEGNNVYAGIPAETEQPGLYTEMIEYPAPGGKVKAYLAKPNLEGKFPAVIVIHENRGLQPHIKDVTRRMAQEGFVAIGPDALSPLGGTPDNDEDKARAMMQELDSKATVDNFVAAVAYLKTNPLTTGKVGCTGFCWGGSMTNQIAVNAPDLNAAVPYYGGQPATEDVPKIKASMMMHYAGEDTRINQGIPAFEEALKKAGIEYKMFIYDGAQHAFNNDTNPDRYNKEAAELAWGRTIEFFKEKLNS